MITKKHVGIARNPATRWGKDTFLTYKGCVAFVETTDDDGALGIGSCFHVGEGVFVTARHVIEGRRITSVGFDDGFTSLSLLRNPKHWGSKPHGQVTITRGPLFHADANVDLACFVAEPHPVAWIPLGGHLNDWLGQYELLLHQTLVLGYPPVHLTDRPLLVASLGEINALCDLYSNPRHPHFVVSSTARGGFSGGPVLVAYDEGNANGGTAVLGVVTQALCKNGEPEQLGYMAVLTIEPVYDLLEQHALLPSTQRIDIVR